MTRVYHHYEQLEEFQAGMWKITRGQTRKEHIGRAANLMRDASAFETAMIAAIQQWPRSCEHNLTADAVNKIAWLGHAGCCVVAGSPEEATRVAWHTLTAQQQDAANAAAARALKTWRKPAYGELDLFAWAGC